MVVVLVVVCPCKTYYINGRHGGLMVDALLSGSSSPGLTPHWGHHVVFLGKILYSQCLFQPRCINGYRQTNNGGTLQWTSIPANGGVYRKQYNHWLDGPSTWPPGATKIQRRKIIDQITKKCKIVRIALDCNVNNINNDFYLNEYPKKFIVDPQYIGLFMILNGKPVTLLFIRSPK